MRLITTLFLALITLSLKAQTTVLGIEGASFTINGKPTFMLGISYYGGLGASDAVLTSDLDEMKRNGFNWLRLWATWAYRNNDISAVDINGDPRKPYLDRLRKIVEECDKRGICVDVTISRGNTVGSVANQTAHRQAIRNIVSTLAKYRNWYLDLANERDVRDARFVSTSELRELRELARRISPKLPVTASFGGHDMNDDYVKEALIEAHLDFVAPHRPRVVGSPQQTEQQTMECLGAMKRIGRKAPILYQEPFRRGYGDWQPNAEDFAADLIGARLGGAAGWCFHNGDNRQTEDGRPRKSFDLTDGSLFNQVDTEERRFLESLPSILKVNGTSRRALAVLSSNPFYFQNEYGIPTVLVGDYTWGSFSDLNYDYPRFFDNLRSRGLNTARVWLWWGCEEIITDPIRENHIEPFMRPGPGTANDGRPKYNLDIFNPDFFKRLSNFCAAARQRGIQLQLIMMDAWMIKHDELWNLHAFQRDNNVNGVDGDPNKTGKGTDGKSGFCSMSNPRAMHYQKALIWKVVETANRFGNVRYEIANENYYNADWELALCDYVKQVEKEMPLKHLVMKRDLLLHSDVVQQWDPAVVHKTMLEKRKLRQPLIFDTDWTINEHDNEVRAAMWTALMSGGHFNYMDDSLEFRLGKPFKDPRKQLHAQIDNAAAFIRQMEPWKMDPNDAIVKSGLAYALVSHQTVAAYLPRGGDVTLDLSGMTGNPIASWYNPLDGKFGASFTVGNEVATRFTAPNSGDWALLVTAR